MEKSLIRLNIRDIVLQFLLLRKDSPIYRAPEDMRSTEISNCLDLLNS